MIILFFTTPILNGQFADAVDFGFNIAGYGPRALSLGGAYTGIADDYSSVFWNPSGLARVKKIEFEFSLSLINREVMTVYGGEENNTKNNTTVPNSLSLTYPIPVYRGSLVFALSYQRVKNFYFSTSYAAFDTAKNSLPIEYQYSDGTPITPFFLQDVFRSEVIDEEGGLDHYSISGAIDIARTLSAGVSFIFIRGQYDYLNRFSQRDINNVYFSELNGQDVDIVHGKRSFSYLMRGLEVRLGLLYYVTPNLSVGGRIDIPISFNVTEDYSEKSDIYFDDPQNNLPILDYLQYRSKTEFAYYYPIAWSVGGGYKLGDFLFSGQIDYRDWSSLKIEENSVVIGGESDMLSSEFHYRGGIEYLIESYGISFRTGFHFAKEPYDDLTKAKEISTFSGGIGYIFSSSLAFNISALYSSLDTVSPGDDIMPQEANKEIHSTQFIFGINYRF